LFIQCHSLHLRDGEALGYHSEYEDEG